MKTLETSPEIITFVDRPKDLGLDPEIFPPGIETFVDRPQDLGISTDGPDIIAFEDRPEDLWEDQDAGIGGSGSIIITTPGPVGPFGNGGINPGGMYTGGPSIRNVPIGTVRSDIPTWMLVAAAALGIYLLVRK